jgi:CRISPR-associated protein (TIGR03984 family)
VKVDLGPVIEARLFGSVGELRWHHRDSGRGRASLVADGTGCSVPEGFNGGPSIYDDRLERRYLLWGRRTDSRDGWTAFAEGRVGTIWVPIKTDARWVRLLAYEYVGEYVGSADTHGNSAVLVERLVRLEPYRGEAKEEGS